MATLHTLLAHCGLLKPVAEHACERVRMSWHVGEGVRVWEGEPSWYPPEGAQSGHGHVCKSSGATTETGHGTAVCLTSGITY